MKLEFKPIATIVGRLNLEPSGEVQAYFAKRVHEVMEQYVPLRDGPLRDTSRVIADRYIYYPQQYAHYQFMGIREDGTHEIKHWTTPGTGPHWDERFISANLKDVCKEVEEYMKREAKNG